MQRNKDQRDHEAVIEALRPFGTTIFTEINALAAAFDTINLSQGFPDFDGPEEIRAKAAEVIMRGPNQYISSAGMPSLRHAIAQKMERFYGVEVDEDHEITVTSGATEGLCATLLGILEPGDEVILLEPAYDSYPPISAIARATIRYVPLRRPDFSIPEEELANAFGPATRCIVINNPHNPCGKVFTKEELTFIASLCSQHDAYAVGDEVYEHLVYDDRVHTTLLSIPEFRNRAFVISSTAKTFSMTGWKVGYVLAAPELSRAVRLSHQFITFCGQAALQEAMAVALDFPNGYYETLLREYTRRRDLICEALTDIGFHVYVPEGAYYVLADIKPLGFDDDLAFCRMLPEKADVAAIPSSCFWKERRDGRDLVRFCFCKRDRTLEEGIRRLRRWLK